MTQRQAICDDRDESSAQHISFPRVFVNSLDVILLQEESRMLGGLLNYRIDDSILKAGIAQFVSVEVRLE